MTVNIRIVLVNTTHPGNIGSTARAMKTMGLHRLYLVSPKFFPNQIANELAAGADDILAQAVVTHSLVAALHDCQLIFATSARPREINLPGLTPAAAAVLTTEFAVHIEIAFVFGREHAGLTNAELLLCHYHVVIPSVPNFSSLNLAQAVQIISYELRLKHVSPVVQTAMRAAKLATIEDLERFYAHLRQVLIELDFFDPSNPKRLLERLHRMFNRIQLEDLDVQILRGILTQIQRKTDRE